MAGVVLAGLMLVVATGATHAPVTAIATGGAGGDAAVVLDDTTMSAGIPGGRSLP
jgi:hypothetical protein